MMLARDLLEPDEVEQLMAACEDSPSGLRDRALIALMAATGVRVSEALAVLPRDLDLRRRRLHVRRGVGDRPRLVWVHPNAVDPVSLWTRARGTRDPDAPLFCSLQGSPLSQSYVRRILPRLGRMAAIEKRVYADGLRHTFAAWAYRSRVTIRSLQVQFGHENISATVAYLERMGLHSGFDELDRALT